MRRKQKQIAAQRPNVVRRVGTSPTAGCSYWLCDDGNVWYGWYTLDSNFGPLAEFLARAAQGHYRITLDESEVPNASS